MAESTKKNLTIGTPRERTLINAEGHFNIKLEIPYVMDGANYSILIDKEGSTPESIKKAVIEDATRIKDLKGQNITI